MSGNKKWTRRAAIGLIGTGAGLFALNTGATTQIYSDRGVELNTTADENKPLLPLSDESGSAEISSTGDETTVYSIRENDLGWTFTDTDILGLESTEGDQIEPSDVTVSNGGDEVVLSCSESEFDGKYIFILGLEAQAENEDGTLSVTAERETESISIDCRTFYSIETNYSDSRDDGERAAPQPDGDNAKGVVENPGNIGRDGNAELKGGKGGDGGGLKVGFRLPPVDSSDCYTLTIKRPQGTGNLEAYLVNISGAELTDRFEFKGKETPFIFKIDGDDAIDISNSDELFLIFEDGSSGNTTNKIDSIKLEAGGNKCEE